MPKNVFSLKTSSMSGEDKPPMYVVKSTIGPSGKKSVRVYKATYVTRGSTRGYKITIKGKRMGVKPGKAAFFDKYDAMEYASVKRGCKYGVDKSSGTCLTKSGRKARDYVKSSGGVGVRANRTKISEEQAQIAAKELNRDKTYSRGKTKNFTGSRARISSYEKAAKKKRKPSAYNNYMKKNLGSMKNMTKTERKNKFSSVASGWKKLSEAEKASYKK
mgnify:CR=1 FL=1